MCLGIPGEIVDVASGPGDLATVDVAGVRRAVNIGLLADDPVRTGDWVLVHVGFAMSKISEEYAREQLRLLAMLGEDRLAVDELEGYRFG